MIEISLSASLVMYKPDLVELDRTLSALQRAAQVVRQDYAVRLELTLVDNSYEDSWHQRIQAQVEKYRRAMPDWSLYLLRSPGNVGYGRGNNLVIKQTDSDYHLVINPDLFVEPEMLVQALRFMEANPDVGLLTPAVFGEDGARHYLCKRNPTLFIMFLRNLPFGWIQSLFKSALARFEMRECNYDDLIDGVEYSSGCCMFFRTRLLQQINGFDTDYFLHFEDADISRRMLKIARVVYVPSVRVVHRWTRGTHHSLKMRLVTIRSGLIYWSKWGGTFG